MNNAKIQAPGPQNDAPAAALETKAVAVDPHAPRKLTIAQNAILTVKLLAAFGGVAAALWAIDVWTSAG